MAADFSALKEDRDYFEPLPADVWLMDDHKWALFIWEQHRLRVGGGRYSLVHADYHWDSTDDFSEDEEAQAELEAADLDGLRAMTAGGERITYDSFIAAAVRRRLFSEVHFYCLQDDSEPLREDLCNDFKTLQHLHADAASLSAAEPAGPLVFDLCLDLFNHSDNYYEGDLWSDAEVVRFLEAVRHHVQAAELVTISLSFGCSGTADDTRHLAELVVPCVLEWRRRGPTACGTGA